MGTDMELSDIESQLSSLNIIVVDDESIARMVLTKGLTRCGYKNITSVSSSKEALELIKNNNFDVALCDVLMPDMDGMQLLTEIRNLSHTSEMSVIMVSATEDLGTVYKCISQGADNYMVKPIRIPQLRNLWSDIWKKKRERAILQ